jgi:uncharacterized protein YndB with AHSA1/START domain
MEQKTRVNAEKGGQVVVVTREFDLPLELLFRAHTEAGLVEEWMGTKVLKMESKKHGSYQYETADAQGKVLFRAGGVIHEFSPNRRIVQTFEMENVPFGVQLQVYDFAAVGNETSQLTMRFIYESPAQRDQNIQIGMVQGVNMAHNRLQEVAGKLK